MSDSWYLTRTATLIRRRLKVDEQGQPVRDHNNNDVYEDASIELPNCSWEPRQSMTDENVDARQQVVSGMSLYCADPHADIRPTDAFLFDGFRYEVVGEVGRFTGSRMGNDHAAVALRRVTG